MPRLRFPSLMLLLFLLIFSSCALRYHQRLIPVRRYFNRDLQYWVDPVYQRGKPGQEILYHKHGRAAEVRYFNENGNLWRITHLDRNGDIFRLDSLVYREGVLTGGYSYRMPEYVTVTRFENEYRRDQLRERRWWVADTLFSREQFLFDHRDQRILQVIWSHDQDILQINAYAGNTGYQVLRNTYGPDSLLQTQTLFQQGEPVRRFLFDTAGRVSQVQRLGAEERLLWIHQFQYDARGALETETISLANGERVAALRAPEARRVSAHSWKNSMRPGLLLPVSQFNDPVSIVTDPVQPSSNGYGTIQDHRILATGQRLLRQVRDQTGKPIADTLYNPAQQAVVVIDYDSLGQPRRWEQFGPDLPPRRLDLFRDEDQRIIREEVRVPPATFLSAVSRFYDVLGQPAQSDFFLDGGRYDGTWQWFHGAGFTHGFRHGVEGHLREAYALRGERDTLFHYDYRELEFFWVELGYDSQRRVIHQRRFTLDGILDWTLDLDSLGRPAEEIQRKKDGTIFRRVDYRPDEGVWVRSNHGPDGELVGQEVHKLNDAGNEILLQSRDDLGRVLWERRYAYRQGRLLKAAQLDADAQPIYVADFHYGTDGTLESETARSARGDTVYTISYRYDAQGREIFRTYQSPADGFVSSQRRYYGENGRIDRDEIIVQHRLEEVVEYTYYPEYSLRIARFSNAAGEMQREEIQNEFGPNPFTPRW